GFAPQGNNFANEIAWLWVFGGSVYDEAAKMPTLAVNPAHIRALDWISSYAARYGPTAMTGSKQFMNREAAMLVQSTTWLELFPEQAPDLRWSVGHIPYPSDGRKTSYSSGMGAIVPRGARNTQGAAEFIKYLSKKDTQLKWYHLTRQLPSREDALQTLLRGREISDPRERLMLELLPTAEGTPPLFSIVRPEFSKNLDRMRRNEITPQQVLDDTQRSVEPHYRGL
ncbi:MAG: extracellular solute-binding protein, partial [Limnochordia bacterium]